MRIYVPATLADLSELHAQSRFSPAPIRAHAVTDKVRSLLTSSDEEEQEYMAMMAAAAESVLLLAGTQSSARRVVVAADVDDRLVRRRGPEPTSVEVTAEISLRQCASVHIDDEGAQADVARVLGALAGRQGGQLSPQDQDCLGDHELLWFATQEIPDLLK